MNSIYTKISITLIATVLFSIIVISFSPKSNFTYSKLKNDWFWTNKTHGNKTFSIIFLGDSRTYRGISTEAIEQILPSHNSLNLGYSSGSLSQEIFRFASKKIDLNAPEKFIILGVSPFSLTEEARKNEHFLQEKNRTIGEIIERKYLNPLLYFFEPIKITDYFNKPTEGYFQKYHKGGWVESNKIPSNLEEAITPYKKALNATKISSKSILDILNFIGEMEKLNIKVYAYRPPSSKKMEALENELLNFDENKIKQTIENNGGKWINIPQKEKYKSYDGSHLNYQSAIELSKFIAIKVKP